MRPATWEEIALSRPAARARLARRRSCRAAVQLSDEVRTLGCTLGHTAPLVANLLLAVAADMDDYLGTEGQAKGDRTDHPIWQRALDLARSTDTTVQLPTTQLPAAAP